MNQQEIRKNTVNACNECVKAKRKCEPESNIPQTCKRCVDKNLPCTYSDKKKRGPKPNSVTEKNTIVSIIKSDPPNDFEIIEVGDKAYINIEITPDTTANIRPYFPDSYSSLNNSHNSFQGNYSTEPDVETYDYQSPLHLSFPDSFGYLPMTSFPSPPDQWSPNYS